MMPICTEIENLIHPVQLLENEYLDESGLIYCSKCRTPRQKRIKAVGKIIEPRCMCACQTAGTGAQTPGVFGHGCKEPQRRPSRPGAAETYL